MHRMEEQAGMITCQFVHRATPVYIQQLDHEDCHSHVIQTGVRSDLSIAIDKWAKEKLEHSVSR
jgi:hypothetical protein